MNVFDLRMWHGYLRATTIWNVKETSLVFCASHGYAERLEANPLQAPGCIECSRNKLDLHADLHSVSWVQWVLLMSPDLSVLHMSFTICHWKRTAKRKRPDFSLSFPPPLPSPLKSRARFEDPAGVFLFYFFFLLPYHPLSFSSVRCPLHHLSPRPRALLMIEISQGVKELSQSGLLHCLPGPESVSQTRTQMWWTSKVVWKVRPKSLVPTSSAWPIPDLVSGNDDINAKSVWDHHWPQLWGLPKHLSINLPSFSFPFLPPYSLISNSRRWNPAVSITGPY